MRAEAQIVDDVEVLGDAHTVPESQRAAVDERRTDRVESGRLAGVHGAVRTGAVQQRDRGRDAVGREADLRPGQRRRQQWRRQRVEAVAGSLNRYPDREFTTLRADLAEPRGAAAEGGLREQAGRRRDRVGWLTAIPPTSC